MHLAGQYVFWKNVSLENASRVRLKCPAYILSVTRVFNISHLFNKMFKIVLGQRTFYTIFTSDVWFLMKISRFSHLSTLFNVHIMVCSGKERKIYSHMIQFNLGCLNSFSFVIVLLKAHYVECLRDYSKFVKIIWFVLNFTNLSVLWSFVKLFIFSLNVSTFRL